MKRCATHLLILCLALPCLAQTLPSYRAGSLAKLEPQPVYAADPQDSWNRIFYLLFTRTVKLRLADTFPEGSPFISIEGLGMQNTLRVSQTFERIESGDRAIEPLYPSFLNSQGVKWALADPQFGELQQALQDALREPATRAPLARALMQADAWASYDIVLHARSGLSGEPAARAGELLPLLAQFIRKLALTPQEIASLPRNYREAQASLNLPPVFDESSGWIEIEWFPHRSHDFSASFRRVARVFVKPKGKPQQFLDDLTALLRKNPELSPDLETQVDATALLTEDLLIDSSGRVVPSPLTYDVQIRSFSKRKDGKFETTVAECELSRQRLLSEPASGGLVAEKPGDPAYLASAGNDYLFASPLFDRRDFQLPVLSNLQRRCQGCHGKDPGAFFTFAQIPIEGRPVPPVRQLRSSDDPHGAYVAQRKMEREDFKSLRWTQ